MSAALYEQKAGEHLDKLGLTTARARLDTAAQGASAHHWSYSHFLGHLLDGEVAERHRKTVEINLQFAKFPAVKTLQEFDYGAQPSVDRRLVEELATGRYLTEGRNVVLLGPPGVGKTHLAIALGVATCQMGHRVYFTSAVDLAHRLSRAVDENRLHRELRNFTRPKLLVIDEVGYLKLDHAQASLLFQVVCQRYQNQSSVILTSNKAFSDWAQVFCDDVALATAVLDRLLHCATIINVKGDSYRLRHKRKAGPTEELKPKEPML